MIDLSTPPSSPSRPFLFVSIPDKSSSKPNALRLRPISFTFSDLRVWNELQSIVETERRESNNSLQRTIVPGWEEYVSILVERFYRGSSSILRGRPSASIQIGGPDRLNVSEASGLGGEAEDDGTSRLPSPSSSAVHLDEVRGEADVSKTPMTYSNSVPCSRPSTETTFYLLEVIRRYVETLDTGIDDFVSASLDSGLGASPDSSLLETLTVTPRLLAALGLNPFSGADKDYARDLVTCKLGERGDAEGVQVTTKCSFMEALEWFVGWT